ncbi:MAG: hypothetical protein M1819_005329 [Sarea resinae]|nr:MAG: hypothetical protein M1819_005329 [Sarea resinae]
MTDILTQLQTCLDQLATQFYASIRYINTYPPSPSNSNSNTSHPPPNPAPTTSPSNNISPNNNNNNNTATTTTPPPPPTLPSALRELSRDLILKEQQIEYLISVLPGIGSSQLEQEARLRVLEREVREAEEERRKAVAERDRLVGVLGDVIVGVRRV